jgi:hypothetical protein
MNTFLIDQIKFVVLYYGINTIKSVSFNTAALRGGSNNVFRSTCNPIRYYSNRPLFDVIPYDFMRIAQSKPSLYVSLNKIPVLCEDCFY